MIPRIRVMDRGHGSTDAGPLSLVTYKDPNAFVFHGQEKMPVFARVCGECGFVELYVEDAGELYQRYRREEAQRGGARLAP